MYWTVHLEGGPLIANHAAVVVGDEIYSFGGYITGKMVRRRRPMEVHVLNTSNFRWSALPFPKQNEPQAKCVPLQRLGHTAVAYGDKVFVWGGRNDEAACNILFCFDTDTLQWSCPPVSGKIPGARDGHSACVINHCMFVFGGFEDEIGRYSQDVHALDFRTMHWSYIYTQGEPPSHREFHSATALGDRMYIFGGSGDLNEPYHSQEEVYSSDMMYLDIQTRRWHRPVTSGDIPIGRGSHCAFVYGGHVFIFGGYNGLRDQYYNDLYRFSTVSNEWQLLKPQGSPPSKRRHQSCLVVGDKMFLFGGTSPSGVVITNRILFQQNLLGEPSPGFETKFMDHNDLHVLDFAPSLRTLCLLTVIQNRMEQSWLPEDIKWEIRAMTTNISTSHL